MQYTMYFILHVHAGCTSGYFHFRHLCISRKRLYLLNTVQLSSKTVILKKTTENNCQTSQVDFMLHPHMQICGCKNAGKPWFQTQSAHLCPVHTGRNGECWSSLDFWDSLDSDPEVSTPAAVKRQDLPVRKCHFINWQWNNKQTHHKTIPYISVCVGRFVFYHCPKRIKQH